MAVGKERSHILVVDDYENVKSLAGGLVSDLPSVMIRCANMLDLALGIMASWPIDCLIIEAWTSYGNDASVLEPETDPEMREGSLRLIRRIREFEQEQHRVSDDCLWIFLLTTQNHIAEDVEIKRLLGDRGSIYLKPFDRLDFSFAVADALGVPCALHPDLQIEKL